MVPKRTLRHRVSGPVFKMSVGLEVNLEYTVTFIRNDIMVVSEGCKHVRLYYQT